MKEQDNLPVGIAQEPTEQARHPATDDAMSVEGLDQAKEQQRKQKKTTFESDEKCDSQSSNNYKEVLSQPGMELTHVQRLLWLQKRRKPGLWVQCDECNRWRFLSHVVDHHELPAKWFCRMNPDRLSANCSVPEMPIRVRDEEDLIHGEYSAGSVVWARMAGWPWWPAMVDDDPDTEQYYWLDGFSDIPTHYNVVFFDATEVTRAWIAPDNLKPYKTNKTAFKYLLKDKKYKKRLEIAISQADDAEKLPLQSRLTKYSFIMRYPGPINKPKKLTRHELLKFEKKLKTKYNLAFPGTAEESDEAYETGESGQHGYSVKRNNMILLGSPKLPKKKIRSAIKSKVTANDKVNSKIINIDDTDSDEKQEKEYNVQDSKNENANQSDSTTVQVGSDVQIISTGLSTQNVTEDSSNKSVSEDVGVEVPKLSSYIANQFSLSFDTMNKVNYEKNIEEKDIDFQDKSIAVASVDKDDAETHVTESVDDEVPATFNTMVQDIQARNASPSSDDFDF